MPNGNFDGQVKNVFCWGAVKEAKHGLAGV
jgi:hypothetical protein